MVDTTLTNLSAASATGATDLFYTVQGGSSLKATGAQLKTWGTTNVDTFTLSTSNFTTESTTARTLGSSDNGKTILCTNGSATTITVPAGLGQGFTCTVVQMGAGQVGFTASSTTINSYGTLTHTVGQYGAASLLSTASNVFLLTGALA